ncbi:hypothetical protein ARTHRO8AJ_290009 [Arthrobacter sp. 8AJ]|nr:hypothetical protein ARTHRO8AJ_290009 [Arthrobacter sp. 8AJ]
MRSLLAWVSSFVIKAPSLTAEDDFQEFSRWPTDLETKGSSTTLLDMTAAYLDLLDRNNIPWMVLRTRNPGRLVYEDEVQVVAVPYTYPDHWPFQPAR